MIFLIRRLLIYLVLGFNLSISQDSTTYKKEEVGPIFYDLPLLDSLINDTLSYDLVKPIIEEDLQELRGGGRLHGESDAAGHVRRVSPRDGGGGALGERALGTRGA